MRAWRRLLRLLPEGFRAEYGEEMTRVVAEHWAALRTRVGPVGQAAFWTRQVWALVRLAVTLRLGRGPGARHGTDAAAPGGTGRRGGVMDRLVQDLRHSIRSLRKHPGFTVVTALTLGLGIGASTATFSAVHAVLLRDLPYEEPERAVLIVHENTATGELGDGASAANVRDLGEASERLAAVGVAEPWGLDLQVEDRAESLRTWSVSERFLEVIGARAALGRLFLPEEYTAGRDRVVLLSHRSWTTRFGQDPGIVGRTLTLDQEPYTVVGVLPADFKFPDASEAWIPRPYGERDEGGGRAADFLVGVGRLAPGVTLEQAQAEADRIARSLAETYGQVNAGLGFRLTPLREYLFGDVRTPLLVLFGAVGVVLLIACANVAGLMLARGAQRQREYALRGALGASTRRLVQHMTVESLVLAGAGCLLGVGLTYGGVAVIRSLGPDHLPRIDEVRVDRVVLLFAVVVTGLSALLSALAPSLRLSRPDLRESLSEGSRGATPGRGGRRLRNGLVVAEVAGAVVLLIGAGLLLKSFAVLVDEELGFEPANRLAVQVFAYGYEPGGREAFVQDALRRIEAVPGVERVALTSNVPAATDGRISSIDIDLPFVVGDRPRPPLGQEPIATLVMVSPNYFEVIGTPVLEGREFGTGDTADQAPVAIVNETLARRHFPDVDPVGERLAIPWDDGAEREIVGVVRDTRPFGHESQPRPEIYVPLTQQGTGALTFLVHAGGDAATLTRPVMRAIWDANPAQAIGGAATLESLLADWLQQRRFNLFLLGSFAVLSLVLAGVGIYGLISFSVEQRIGELGIRRALGGRSADLLRMVVGEGARLAALGIGIGVVGAVLLTRFLRGMLFGVEPTDPLTFGALALTVLAVAAMAAFVPGVRAMRVDPVLALRNE